MVVYINAHTYAHINIHISADTHAIAHKHKTHTQFTHTYPTNTHDTLAQTYTQINTLTKIYITQPP